MKLNQEVQKEEGITLIALVVTIIVLLILAGISIMMLTGENRYLTKSWRSERKNANSTRRRITKTNTSRSNDVFRKA